MQLLNENQVKQKPKNTSHEWRIYREELASGQTHEHGDVPSVARSDKHGTYLRKNERAKKKCQSDEN